MQTTTVAATGHRPPRLGGYGERAESRLKAFALERLTAMVVNRGSGSGLQFLVGMAQGWDMAVAEACLELGIPYVAAVPFPGQEKPWPERAQRRYRRLLAGAAQVHVCSETFSVAAMKERNRWMVDRCHRVLALFDGKPEGGTYDCVKYARARNKPVENLWNAFCWQLT